MSRANMKIILTALIALLLPSVILATTNIDSTNRYAWSENAGWIDFGSSQGNVVLSDTALTGYAWSETMGWISLSCQNTSTCTDVNYGVLRDSATSHLSGYAWSENMGWINFNPQGGGVSVDNSGSFQGSAYGENMGWIIFNCQTTNSCDTVNYKLQANVSVTPTAVSTPSAGNSMMLALIKSLPTTAPKNTIPVAPVLPQKSPVAPLFTQTLKLGSFGDQVTMLQNKLKELGFLSQKITSSGYFGNATLKAVQDFQIANKIATPNIYGFGLVGPATRKVLNGLR